MGRGALAVVVPAWNAAPYLAETIESVLAQTVPADTIVVVDDGSDDATAAVAAQYPTVRLVQQAHAGAGAARNTGVGACTEPLLAFLDADDVWMPDKLERQLPLLDDPAIDAVFGLAQNFLSPDKQGALGDLRFESGAVAGFIPSALVVSRTTWDRVGPFATGAALTDWVDWYLRLVDGGAVTSVADEVVVRRRVHGGNATMVDPDQRLAYVHLVKASMDRRRHRQPAEGLAGR